MFSISETGYVLSLLAITWGREVEWRKKYASVGFFWVDKIQSIAVRVVLVAYLRHIYGAARFQTVIMASPVQAFLIWRCWTVRISLFVAPCRT